MLVHNECTYSRVQGGDSGTSNYSKDTIRVNSDGSITIMDKKSDLYARREVNKFLSGRIQAILLDGFEVPGITARYALQNKLIYNKEIGGYENDSV